MQYFDRIEHNRQRENLHSDSSCNPSLLPLAEHEQVVLVNLWLPFVLPSFPGTLFSLKREETEIRKKPKELQTLVLEFCFL